MLELVVLVIVGFLAFPPSVSETRNCLVEIDGKCVQREFGTSRGDNPLGNTRELIEADRKE